MNQVQGFAVRVLGAYVVKLQVVETDAAAVPMPLRGPLPLGQRKTHEPLGCIERVQSSASHNSS